MLDFIEGRVTEPPRLFQQAMARFVREIIMAPNVVNIKPFNKANEA